MQANHNIFGGSPYSVSAHSVPIRTNPYPSVQVRGGLPLTGVHYAGI